MGRSHVIVGLKDGALKFTRHLKTIGAHDSIVDAFGGFERYQLTAWRTPDGRKIHEVLQCEPWASGPRSFTCLRNPDHEHLFQWSDDEVQARTQ